MLRLSPIVFLGQRSALIVIVFALTLLVSRQLFAQSLPLTQEERDWIAAAPVIRVGIDADYPPYSFMDDSGRFQGLAPNILTEIESLTGLIFEPVPGLSWDEIINGARNRTLDVIATAVQTPERERFLNFTDIYIPTPLVIMSRKADDRILSASDLDGRTVALVEGYSVSQTILREHPTIIPKPVATAPEGLQAVAIAEADAYVGVLGVSTYLAQEHGLANLRVAARYDDSLNGQRLGTRSDWPELSSILGKALGHLDQTVMSSVFDKWIPVLENFAAGNRAIPFELTDIEQAWLDDRDDIRIGVMNAWPPMDFVDSDGKVKGIGVDFLRAMNRRLGGKIAIVPGEWSRIYNDVREGRLDALTGITPREDRLEHFNFTTNYVVVPHTIFARTDEPYIANASQLAGRRVAVEEGFFVIDIMREKYPDVALRLYANTSDALGAVAKGEADAYIGNRAVAFYIIRNELIASLKAHGRFLESKSNNAIGARKDTPILRDILQKALYSLTPQERQLILKDWVAPEDPSGRPFVLSPEEKDWLSAHPIIRVAGDRAWPPIEFLGEQGVFEGIAVDYLAILSRLMNVRFEFDMTSDWNAVVEKLKNRELDMFSAAAPTQSRQEFANFTPPYLSLPAVIFSRENDPPGASLSALEGKKVATVRGYALTEFLRASGYDLDLLEVDDVPQGLRHLQDRKVDAYIGSILVTGYYLRQLGYSNIAVSGHTPYGINVSMAVRSDWAIFSRILRRAVAHISEKERADVAGRWIGIRVNQPPDYKLILVIVAIAVAVVAIVVLWALVLRRLRNEAAEQAAYLQAVLEASADGIITTDEHGIIQRFNSAAETIFAYNANEIVGRNVSCLMPEPYRQEHQGDMTRHLAGGAPGFLGVVREVEGLRHDGSVFPMDFAVCEAKRPGEPLFVGILRDITERKESERRVREEKERAESANRAKSEFLASMSHELRTPLNAILGFAQLMQIDQEEPLTETQQISVEHIKNGGDHLLEVLNEVLDLAKIEAGGVDLEMESVRVGALIGECVSLMAATADELGVKMTMDTALADDPTCVRADATRLKQVFLNLISNAAKYNRPNGSVTISSVAHKAGIQRVSVADTGIGVSDEQLDDLFKPFSRLAVADTEIEGTGIGLTITKRLVERMGGVIGVKSVPGEGSVFWVEMPLAD